MANHMLVFKSGFPRAPLANGIGRYIGQLQRVTLKFCKSHGSSKGMREFLENDLIDFARENPGVVVYVKPRRHRSPVIVAEYLNGEKHWLSVRSFEREEIIKWIETMKTQAKDGALIRLRKMWHTECPSIQGPWSPFTYRDHSINLLRFPDSKVGTAIVEKTGTQKIIELFEQEKQNVKKLPES